MRVVRINIEKHNSKHVHHLPSWARDIGYRVGMGGTLEVLAEHNDGEIFIIHTYSAGDWFEAYPDLEE